LSASKDLHNHIQPVNSIAPVAAPGTGATNGDAVNILGPTGDLRGYESMEFIVSTGALTTGTVKIQESADGSTGWADADGTVDTLPQGGGNSEVVSPSSQTKIGYVGDKQFARAVVTLSADGPLSCVAILGNPSRFKV